MKALFSGKIRVILIIVVTMICSISIGAMAQSSINKAQNAGTGKAATGSGSADVLTGALPFENTCSRSQWLYDLMTVTQKAKLPASSDAAAIYEAAASCGLIDSYEEAEFSLPLNRIFVAETTVRALGYKRRDAGRIVDINMLQADLSTMAYYGYFIPDVNDMVYPEQKITEEEYAVLLGELNRYKLLRGKTVLTFGDSIMHGSGNDGMGIGQIIAEKYGMTACDYSVPGATMGVYGKRGHIRDQLKEALNDDIKPDVILINGGTNDMVHTALGTIQDSYDVADIAETDFSGGFEKTLYNIKNNWKNVPVIYIRAHNMNLGSDDNERIFGERALSIAHKWDVTSVDLYNNTDMNTEDSYIGSRYSYRDPDENASFDSIHPNAIGYAKYYLPPITQEIITLFCKE